MKFWKLVTRRREDGVLVSDEHPEWHQPQTRTTGLGAIIGKWPGTETDEQIEEALARMTGGTAVSKEGAQDERLIPKLTLELSCGMAVMPFVGLVEALNNVIKAFVKAAGCDPDQVKLWAGPWDEMVSRTELREAALRCSLALSHSWADCPVLKVLTGGAEDGGESHADAGDDAESQAGL